ncbi:MAG: ferredoxin--nitrite reductase [Candidatus Methylacidiphilales bacterium]
MSQALLSTPPTFTPGPTPEEQLKVVKDGLDVIQDVYTYAETGFKTIPEDDFTRMKWYGVYRQKPKDSGYFMLRTKIPGGQLNAAQLAVMAGIADDYAHGFGDITTRQTFQFHWLTIEQFPDIFARLRAVGMTTSGACGDDTRNIVGCPVAGIDPDEIIDATPQLQAVSAHLTDNREFSNLPRKYKISISGCRIHCAQPDINCVGLFGLERKVGGRVEAGFGIKVGGGLSAAPHLAQTLSIFLKPEDVLPVVHYVSVLYRDHGFRHARSKARFKFLVADWGAERFLAELEKVSGRTFERHTEFAFPEDPETDHLGIRKQKQGDLYYVGISFAGGRVRGWQLRKLSELSARLAAPGQDAIRTTNKQNLILLNIPERNLDPLLAELREAGLVYEPSNFRQGCVSCTGIEFCNLAVAETKNRMIDLVGQLEARSGHFTDKIRIHFSGCPSSCGQHQIADIGFRGATKTVDGVKKEAFDMFLGGKLGSGARFNTLIQPKVPYEQVDLYVDAVLRFFQAHRQEGERFDQFVARTPKEQLKAIFAPLNS